MLASFSSQHGESHFANHGNRPPTRLILIPLYCDVIIQRWQEVAGKRAILDGDGRTFDEVAGERLPKAA